MAQTFIFKKVVAAVKTLPQYKEKRILDLSCGEGEILQALYNDNCNVEGTHYKTNDYIIEDEKTVLSKAPIHKNVALDQPLPFENDSYDIVILTEVIEHLPNHFIIISEINRILKKGGYLLLTTPNIQRLHSRLKYLFTGTHKLIRRRIGWDITQNKLYEFHINPLDFHVIHSLLGIYALQIQDIQFTRVKAKHFYLLLLCPFIWLFSLLEANTKNRNKLHKKCEIDLFEKMCSFRLLFSEQLFLIAKKNDQ